KALYARLLGRLRRLGCRQVVRVWNFLPGINVGMGDGEGYVQFNVARAAAFEEFGIGGQSLPAATAVGTAPGQPLIVVMLASLGGGRAIENPRQVSAYRYPRLYGPRPPAFSRGMLVGAGGLPVVYVSGTASIVGHKSVHRSV